MNGRTLISTGLVVVAACCCCFAVSHAQPAPSAADGLTARLSLHRDRVLLGEPLRIRVSLVNRGATDIVTAQAPPMTFTRATVIQVVIRRGTDFTARFEAQSTGARALLPAEPFLEGPGGDLWRMSPAETVRAHKTLVPWVAAGEGLSFLPAGQYEVSGFVFTDLGELATPPVQLTVEELPAADRALLEVYRPDGDLISWLEGRYGAPTDALLRLTDDVRRRFPATPHRVHLEYRSLPRTADVATYGAAAERFLADFPQGPYRDDVLYDLGLRQADVEQLEDAVESLTTLVEQYPDSPWSGLAASKLEAVQRELVQPAR